MRGLPQGLAIMAGIVVALVAAAALAAVAVAVVRLTPPAEVPRFARVAAAALAGGTVLAFGAGGWTAARIGRAAPLPAWLVGGAVGALALAASAAAGWALLRGAFDLDSIGVEIGVVDPGPPPTGLPDSRAPGEPDGVDLRAMARARVAAAAGYLTAFAGLLTAAAALGGMTGVRSSAATGDPPR